MATLVSTAFQAFRVSGDRERERHFRLTRAQCSCQRKLYCQIDDLKAYYWLIVADVGVGLPEHDGFIY